MSVVQINLYDASVQDQIKDHEIIESYIYDISHQQSGSEWIGLERVALLEIKFEGGKTLYAIEIEDAREIVETKNRPNDEIVYDMLYMADCHEAGEFVVMMVFDDKEEAQTYMHESYPQLRLEAELNERFPH